MKRFDVVFNIPSPYRLHMLRELHRQLADRGVDFHVHFMAKGHKNRPKSWLNPLIDFPHTYWRDFGFGEHHFNPGLVWRIVRNPPDFLLAGSPYDTLTCILILLFSKVPVKIAGAEGNTKTPGKMGGFIGWFKRNIYSTAMFASVPGHDAIRYFALHQARTQKTMPTPVILPNLVDESRFKPRDEWKQDEIESARDELGCDKNSRLCIIPARLEPEKGLVEFVKQLDAIILEGWKIVIFGQGSLRPELGREILARGLGDSFAIKEYVPYEKMPLYYAASDVLLLPSLYDPNPLSVPEALFSGLPIALSDQAGNVEEGVAEGRNGWRLPVRDSAQYRKVLANVFSADIEQLKRMGRCSYEMNARFWDSKEAVRRYLDTIVGGL